MQNDVNLFGLLIIFQFVATSLDHQTWGTAIRFATEELLNDKEIALAAVLEDGRALEFLPNFSNDRQVVLEAVSNFSFSLHFASQELGNDREIVKQTLSTGALSFQFISKELKQDEVIRKFAIQHPLFGEED